VAWAPRPTATYGGEALDALSRWRPASSEVRGESESDVARVPPPGVQVPSLAPAQAADGPRVTDDGRPLTTELLAALPSAGQPSARTTDVLLRLAQARNLHSRHAPDAYGAPPFAQMVTTAPLSALPGVSAPGAAPVPPSPGAGEQVLHQIVTSLRMQWKDGIGEAKLQLRPDALGTVSVSLRVEGGAVTAVVRADSPQVQEWVLQHQQTLRQQLELVGLQLDELVVSPDDQGQQGRQEAQPERHRRQRPSADDRRADSPRFEQLL
jgi:flagellar hook-length control protein FliK